MARLPRSRRASAHPGVPKRVPLTIFLALVLVATPVAATHSYYHRDSLPVVHPRQVFPTPSPGQQIDGLQNSFGGMPRRVGDSLSVSADGTTMVVVDAPDADEYPYCQPDRSQTPIRVFRNADTLASGTSPVRGWQEVWRYDVAADDGEDGSSDVQQPSTGCAPTELHVCSAGLIVVGDPRGHITASAANTGYALVLASLDNLDPRAAFERRATLAPLTPVAHGGDNAELGNFGLGVSCSSAGAVAVGAPAGDTGENMHVYVFAPVFEVTDGFFGASSWQLVSDLTIGVYEEQTLKLTTAFSSADDVLAVGSHRESGGDGVVHVYVRDAGTYYGPGATWTWRLATRLAAPVVDAGGGGLGLSIALATDTTRGGGPVVAACAPGTGAAWVFQPEKEGATFTTLANTWVARELSVDAASCEVPACDSIAIAARNDVDGGGFIAAVGMRRDGVLVPGEVHLFQGSAAPGTRAGGDYVHVGRVSAPALTPSDDDYGAAVAVVALNYNAALFVGAPRTNINFNDGGVVYTQDIPFGTLEPARITRMTPSQDDGDATEGLLVWRDASGNEVEQLRIAAAGNIVAIPESGGSITTDTVYVYERLSTGTQALVARLESPDAIDAKFGVAVSAALFGDVHLVAVGAPDAVVGPATGRAFVYHPSSTFDLTATWVLSEVPPPASVAGTTAAFGHSLAIGISPFDGSPTLVVSSQNFGIAAVYRLSDPGDAASGWVELGASPIALPVGLSDGSFRWFSLALHGDLLVVGRNDAGTTLPDGEEVAAVDVFAVSTFAPALDDVAGGDHNDGFTHVTTLIAGSESFGQRPAVHATPGSMPLVVVGEPGADNGIIDAGAIWLFAPHTVADLSGAWQSSAKTPSDGNRRGRFGWDVALSATALAVGCPSCDVGGEKAGALYVLTRTIVPATSETVDQSGAIASVTDWFQHPSFLLGSTGDEVGAAVATTGGDGSPDTAVVYVGGTGVDASLPLQTPFELKLPGAGAVFALELSTYRRLLGGETAGLAETPTLFDALSTAGCYGSKTAAGVAVSDCGDVILLEGSYPAPHLSPTVKFTLRGATPALDTGDPTTTITTEVGTPAFSMDGIEGQLLDITIEPYGYVEFRRLDVTIDAEGVASTSRRLAIDPAASKRGGLILLTGSASAPATLTLGNVVLRGGEAVQGGAVYTSGVSTLTLSLCRVHHNTANAGGALFAADGATIHLIDTRIDYNTASTRWGGAIALEASTLLLEASQESMVSDAMVFDSLVRAAAIQYNDCQVSGGAIYAGFLSTVRTLAPGGGTFGAAHGYAITNNTAWRADGGGIALDGASMTAEGLRILGNAAHAGLGGGVSVTGGETDNPDAYDATCQYCEIVDNQAAFGGCIGASEGTVSIQDSLLHHCMADADGGGFWADDRDSRLFIARSTMSAHMAQGAGGGAYLGHEAVGYVWETKFDGCSVEPPPLTPLKGGYGGGIACVEECGLTVRAGSVFVENEASAAGGGIYLNDGSADISDTAFLRNAVTRLNGGIRGGGGGLYASATRDARFEGRIAVTVAETCSFAGNTAPGGGGILTITDVDDDNMQWYDDLCRDDGLACALDMTTPRVLSIADGVEWSHGNVEGGADQTNVAERYGGADMLWLYRPPFGGLVDPTNPSKDTRGGRLAGGPAALRFGGGFDAPEEKTPPGIPLPPFTVYAVSSINQPTPVSDGAWLIVEGEPSSVAGGNVAVEGTLVARIGSGVDEAPLIGQFDGVMIAAPPGSDVTLMVTLTVGDSLGQIVSLPPLFHTVRILPCGVGAETDTDGRSCRLCRLGHFSADESDDCQSCEPGTFAALEGQRACTKCPVGTYNEDSGSAGEGDCNACPARTTTLTNGASHKDMCVPVPGTFRGFIKTVHYDERDHVDSPDEVPTHDCVVGMDCTAAGLRIEDVPLAPGYWRATVTDVDVRRCPNADFCLGGVGGGLAVNGSSASYESPLCIEGHTGPFCTSCLAGWGRSQTASSRCAPCQGQRPSMSVVIAGGLVFCFALSMVFVVLLFFVRWVCGCRKGNRVARAAGDQLHLRQMAVPHLPGASAVEMTAARSVAPPAPAAGRSGAAAAIGAAAAAVAEELADAAEDSALEAKAAAEEKVAEAQALAADMAAAANLSKSIASDIVHGSPLMLKWKQLVGFLQVCHAMPLALPSIQFPDVFRNIAASFRWLTEADVFDFVAPSSCEARSDHYGKLVVATCVPMLLSLFVAIILAAVTWLRKYCARKCKYDTSAFKEPPGSTLSFSLLLIFFVYPGVSAIVLRTFHCETFANGQRFLFSDYSVDCDGDERGFWVLLATIGVIVYPIGCVVFFLGVLYSHLGDINPLGYRSMRLKCRRFFKGVLVKSEPNKTTEDDEYGILADARALARVDRALRTRDGRRKKIEHLSFLWEAYLPSCWYWEAVEMVRKLTLTGIVIFVGEGSIGQIVFALLVSCASTMLLQAVRPYVSKTDNRLGMATQWETIGAFFCALLLYVNINDAGLSSDGGETGRIIGIALVALNIFAVAAAAYMALEERYLPRAYAVIEKYPHIPIFSCTFCQALLGRRKGLHDAPALSERVAIRMKVLARLAVKRNRAKSGIREPAGEPGVHDASSPKSLSSGPSPGARGSVKDPSARLVSPSAADTSGPRGSVKDPSARLATPTDTSRSIASVRHVDVVPAPHAESKHDPDEGKRAEGKHDEDESKSEDGYSPRRSPAAAKRSESDDEEEV
uniref:Tyrosine-protein kinase ephrin type A/B receptor-like domain-containing protein n=1 Tax=Bicosoecida sp. CB-2014 TaxID=1486930 RepID=A0A7S1CKE0_9STRA|mmetsp:Transcript_4229/g.15582  ORF Transcript_4229/g.15582 Transcript_4229/m.15582 type:complete len:2715 (+) Transcript_4229:99-8243(+)